ncbi:type II toxin-antitoxin system VapC family toxin [Methylobacterium sp. WL116]|uniref:type II toxin-antitoxin system VapC family toxin n=1 Tax=Methylobacterium sp. WL116 TaxID=2603889 RepID=UPI0011C79C38|nr:type II toxin-antitoxin system VapC family toxin [Methylobacterium sp. WL116]TXM92747.1 type II toxin-antitoxin system VapC family toxin [Methylobacterium sp. WL116]
MSLCILDASMALAWVLPIESDASDILEQVAAKGAIVPGLWALEVRHVLLTAERKRRIVTAERTQALELLAALPISIDTETARHAWSATMTLASKHGLSLYDASYLELAIRCSRPLASRDAKLLRAASACSVPVIV